MEIIGLIVALFAGLMFYKNKSDKAKADAKIAETKGRDAALKESQDEINAAIDTLDKGIAKMKAEQEAEARKRAEDNMTLKERADRIKRNLK